jgi:hypothetical protein
LSKSPKKSKSLTRAGNRPATISAQQTIPYVRMLPDGICQLPGGVYTKTLEYEDINYSVASAEDQTAIFGGWSSWLNYFDSSLPFQLSFVNRRSRSGSRYKVNISEADVSDLMAAVVQYAKTRPAFDGYKAAKYSRKYLAEHEAELADYRAAKATMAELLGGEKLPKMDVLKEKRRQLAARKKALYLEYRKAQQDMRELVAVKGSVDHLRGLTDNQRNKEQAR